MASKHVVVWPRVRVTVDGKSKILDGGELVPSGVSDVDLDNLVSFGAIAGVRVAEVEDDDSAPTTVKDILAVVGEDKVRAQEYLDAENAKGDKARAGLVKDLTAIVEA